MKLFQKCSVVLMALIMLLNLINPLTNVYASSNGEKSSEDYLLDQVGKLDEITNPKEVKYWIKHAETQIKNGKIKLNSNNLDVKNAKVYRIADTSYVSIGIPIVSSNHHEVSNIAIHFDEKNKKLVTYTELEFMRSASNTLQIRLSVDNQEQINKITEDEFLTNKEYQESLANQYTTFGIDWDGLGKCLGISSVTARWLMYICGATCVITLGTACVVCIAGGIGIAGGQVSACLGDNWD